MPRMQCGAGRRTLGEGVWFGIVDRYARVWSREGIAKKNPWGGGLVGIVDRYARTRSGEGIGIDKKNAIIREQQLSPFPETLLPCCSCVRRNRKVGGAHAEDAVCFLWRG